MPDETVLEDQVAGASRFPNAGNPQTPQAARWNSAHWLEQGRTARLMDINKRLPAITPVADSLVRGIRLNFQKR